MAENTVKFGDTFYLKHATNQYIVAVNRGTYNWPQLGNTGKVTLQLVGNSEGEVVRAQSRIKIKTTELTTGNNDILGAFSNSQDCYYWQDGYDENKQSWIITKVTGKGGAIRYDERVYLTNSSYTNQKLCADTSYVGYITTTENTKDWWILESAVSVSSDSPPAPSDQESSSPPTVSESLPSQAASAPPNVAPSPAAPTQPSNTPVITEVGPAGSSISATAFSIQPRTGTTSRIHSINVSGGWAVDKIQVEYETLIQTSAEIYASEVFGGGAGSVSTFALAPGDYLISVSGTWGAQAPGYPKEEIISVQFHTHQGNQSQVFGGGNDQKQVEEFTLVAPEGSEIIGFFGAYGGHQNILVRLGVYTRPVQSAKAGSGVIEQPSEPATASPNISPSPSPVSPEQFIPIEQSGTLPEPASAPPNVAPSPPQPSVASSTPVTPAPAIAPPIPPVRLQGSQMVLVLNEKHQGISAGGGALRPQGHFTIEAWVYPATNAGKQVIFADGETLFYLEGGELKFQTPLSTEAIASVGAGITSGSWYHVAVTRAGSRSGDTKLYINGVNNDNQKAIFPVLSFGNTYLGGQPDVPDSRFQGKLLEVRVWRYVRSPAEIEANRLYPLTGRELGLIRYWSLNQTVGSILEDKTTNRAVGILRGDPVWEEVEIPLKLKLDPLERLTRSTGLEDYGYWFKEMAKQQKTEADPPFRRGRIWR